jgi:hypothetical protein
VYGCPGKRVYDVESHGESAVDGLGAGTKKLEDKICGASKKEYIAE